MTSTAIGPAPSPSSPEPRAGSAPPPRSRWPRRARPCRWWPGARTASRTWRARIRRDGGTALVLEADVTDEQQANDAVRRTVAELGRLDTLINNAGVMLLGPIVDAPVTEWQQMVELNVLGLLYCAHAALPHLLPRPRTGPRQVADMVNVSSVAGRVARTGNGVYSLTKHGIGAFSESLRQEVTRRHVRVSLMEPGATSTELITHNRAEVIEGLRGQFNTAEPMQSEDIADAITYIVTRPRHVAISEMLIRPTEQERCRQAARSMLATARRNEGYRHDGRPDRRWRCRGHGAGHDPGQGRPYGHDARAGCRTTAGGPDDAWDGWDRKGVTQFRLGHFFLSRYPADPRGRVARRRGGDRKGRRTAPQSDEGHPRVVRRRLS